MYQRLPSWVLGFHGTDAATVKRVLNSRTANLRPSNNDYDWLGDGAYFWENDPERAMSYVREKMRRENDERKPAVIGAIIDLGFCMNLVDRPALLELQSAHDDLKEDSELLGFPMPVNQVRTCPGSFVVRWASCATTGKAWPATAAIRAPRSWGLSEFLCEDH